MKKINGNKLALHRETLATLNADVLAEVAGGAISLISGPSMHCGPTTRTNPTPGTRASCQFICQPQTQQTRLICPPGPAQK